MAVEIIETQGIPNPETPQKPVAEKPKEEPKYVRLEDLEKINQAINNTREYNNRQLAELKSEIQKLAPKPIQTGDPDLDELVQTNWKAAVAKITEDVLSKHNARQQAESEAEHTRRILEESKAKVYERHKELSDPGSPKTQVFLKVLEDNPDFTKNPRGPILAMYEMENRLKADGKLELGDEKPVRETRSRAATIPNGTPNSQKGYSLSKADLDFCRINGINPENYKRLKSQREASA